MFVVSDMDSRDAIFELIDVGNEGFQVGDLHIGDDKDVRVGRILQGLHVFDIQPCASSKIVAKVLINLLSIPCKIDELTTAVPRIAEIVNGNARIISEVGI